MSDQTNDHTHDAGSASGPLHPIASGRGDESPHSRSLENVYGDDSYSGGQRTYQVPGEPTQ